MVLPSISPCRSRQFRNSPPSSKMPPKKLKHPLDDGPHPSITSLLAASPASTQVTAVPSPPVSLPMLSEPPSTQSTRPASVKLATTSPTPVTRTTRSVSAASASSTAPSLRSTFTHERTNTNDPAADYESPLKKLKKAMSTHNRRLIKSVEDLRDFIAHNDVTDPEIRGSVRIQARLLWTVNETVHGLRFLRLYLGEEREPEPLHEQQAIYQSAQRDDPCEANQFLITLSLYDIAANNPSLPHPGDIVSFIPTKLRLYRNCCQVETRLQHIVLVTPA